MIEYQSKCGAYNLASCGLHLSSKFENTWIVSVKGDLSTAKYRSWSSSVLLYQMEQSYDNSSSMKLTQKHLDGHLQSFEQASSIIIRITTERAQWLDITLINNRVIPKHNTLHSSHILNQGLNAIPRIINYGPAMFSNLDVSVKLLNNKSKSGSIRDTNMTIKVQAGHRLFPYNATRHSMYFIYLFEVLINKCLHK